MLINLISYTNIGVYNSKLAHKIGIERSAYVSEIVALFEDAFSHKKTDENGYFKVDRYYIEERTALQKSEQLEIDKSLKSIKLIDFDSKSKDKIKIDFGLLEKLIVEDNAENNATIQSMLHNAKNIKKTTTEQDKREAIKVALKRNINVSNAELYDAYCEWIECVYQKDGWMTSSAVKEAQRLIDEYTNKDLDIALAIIRIASTGGMRDMSWAIRDYEKNNVYKRMVMTKKSYTKSEEVKDRSREVKFTDEEY